MSRSLRSWLPIALGVSLLVMAALPAGAMRSPNGATTRDMPVTAANHATAQASYGQVPLAFELNQGQTDSAVRFLAHGRGYTLFLTPGAAVLSLGQNGTSTEGQAGQGATFAQTVSMRWLGANPNPVVTGEQPLPGIVNYFIGNDPSKWQTHIPTFAQVRYHNVYPGVDLVYYGTGGQLEYDFVVAPGADPARIQLGFTGQQQLRVDLAGNLRLTLLSGTLQQDQPAIYQTVNGARQMVPGGFTLTRQGQAGFTLGAYNPRLPLVIDPSYKFSTYLGGTDIDSASAVAVDGAGDAYIAGHTYSTDFPTANPFRAANAGSYDVFVSKFNPAGTALLYSTYLGGSSGDSAAGIAVDSAGDAYIVGSTGSANFPLLNAYDSTPRELFTTKLTADGAGLVYSTYFGGSGPDIASGIALDSSGNVYLTGATASSNFPTLNPIQANDMGDYDAFVSKLNASGSDLVYSTYLGGATLDEGYSIAVDAAGAAYVAGYTTSLNFPTTPGVVQPTRNGENAFISKVDPTGSKLDYSTYLGGNNSPTTPFQQAPVPSHEIHHTGFSSSNCYDHAYAIAVDASGDAFITGTACSRNFPTTSGAFQTTYPGTGEEHTFVSKLNPTASALLYSTFVAGTTYEEGDAITVDYAGNAYITGQTYSTDFPLVNQLQSTKNAIYAATFVTEINASGSALLYSSYLGGSTGYGTFGRGIALNLGRDVYVTGETSESDFPTKNAFQKTYGGPSGGGDAFVTKLRVWPSVDTTTGVFRPSNGALYLKNANTTGPADTTLFYGQPGDQPITGDWNGKGYKSIGIYRNGTFYLRNSNTTGTADIVAAFGASGDIPVAGDWTGKGYDSIGVYRPSTSTFYLRDSNTSGPPDHTVTLGITGDVPIVGDWTGKGYDSVGVFRPSNGVVYLRNSNTTGFADINFVYGIAGDKPVVGDWNADGVDTIGVDRNGRFLLRNSNSTGPADLSFYLGAASDQPIAGAWLAPLGSLPNHRPAAPPPAPANVQPGAAERARQLP